MSPNSAGRAEKIGYTNVKVYHEGMPVWSKKNYLVTSAQFLKEAYIDKDIPHVLVDVRPEKAARKGFIQGAVSIPASAIAENISKFPPKEKKAPVIFYDDNGGEDAKKAAKALISAGYTGVIVLSNGFESWKTASYPVQTGALASAIVYVAKPRPGEISVDDFKKIAAGASDSLILDVRNTEEAEAGMIKGAKLVPDEEIETRLAEIPADKMIVTHCSTGVRAEMAYHKLKEKGYKVKFLNAAINVDKSGSFTIEKP